ncbi:MAG: methyltransferase domain-containing protein [Bacteroidota bacterium]
MGSQTIQGKLWGQRPKDWAGIQEQTGKAGYDFALASLSITAGTTLLDIGCGSGYFIKLAGDKGADATGLDATAELIEEAKKGVPDATFLTGEMEELPFNERSFDIVCGFNSFQYAASTKNALIEARRVLKKGGKLVTMIWGNKEDCEAATYLKAVGSLLPPPPPGAGGPFALSENQLLEKTLEEAGFTIINNTDVVSVWDYPDTDTALKGLLSSGPVARAIENAGFDKVFETTVNAIQPYIQTNGHVVYKNKFRVVISE